MSETRIAHPEVRKWLVTLVGGLIVGIVTGVLVQSLPGLGRTSPPALTGQIIADDGGRALVIDPSARHPPSLLVLPARERTAEAMRQLEPAIKFVESSSPSWDARRNVFRAVSTILRGAEASTKIDSAVSDYSGDGAPLGTTLVSSIEALWSVSNSPSTDQELIAGDTQHVNGARIGVLIGGGRQRVLSKDSLGPVSWSPNGQTLAYACSINGGSPTLCTYNLRQSRQRVYTFNGFDDVGTPAISPNGQSVVMTASLGTNVERPTNLVIVDLTDGHARILTDDGRERVSPVWSPTGEVIAYAAPSAIILHVIHTGQEVELLKEVTASSLQWVTTPREHLGEP
jgi:dipeptidyl aminopeptidase/acylaminoacyl peptidase